ncbi:YgfZ/GcvT domain-containing protein [Kordiimonas sp.]|uniref:CAF17-like 4Fe-4S cluster assembly/insertion protein YgfZ n=1 Tax=Kordiimonas sp. TaxID=1970157 RepID=UPI003A8FC2BD
MTDQALKLDTRAVLRLSGHDACNFLQGLVTNDVTKVAAGQAVYAALLTPQGKFLYDMIIMAEGEDLLLDVEAARKDELLRRLMMYKLRADVTITDETSLSVWAVWGRTDTASGQAPDPRDAALGTRLISDKKPDAEDLTTEDYEAKRLRLGVPDSSRDMAVEKYFWLETDAERLNGVSFTKGCFIGQELTARMKHRTALKKKLVAVTAKKGTLRTGQSLTTDEGKTAGEIRTTDGTHAIAYFRLEFADASLNADGVPVQLA